MSLEVKKKLGENSQGLIRRFTKKVKQSGVLMRARKNRFFKRDKSKQMQQRAALRREELKKEYENLKKLGQEKVTTKNFRR